MKRIGCSEIHELLGLEPYGCARRLMYKKLGVKEDFPELYDAHKRRGNALEPVAIAEFERKYDCKVAYTGKKQKEFKHGLAPLIGHPDGMLNGNPFEVKCPSIGHYRKIKKDGLPKGWIYQGQGQMIVSGTEAMTYCIFHPDDMDPIKIEVEKNQDICEQIIDAAFELFRIEERNDLAPQLPLESSWQLKLCRGCQYRKTCRGDDMNMIENLSTPEEAEADLSDNDEFARAIDTYLDNKEIKESAEEAMGVAREKMEKLIGDRQLVVCNSNRVSYKFSVSNRLDTKTLKKELPEVAKKYMVQTQSRRFLVYND